MSALRLGRNPDGTRAVLILEPAVGRTHFSRSGIAGGGPPLVVGRLVTGESQRGREARIRRDARSGRVVHGRVGFVDLMAPRNLDNGGVEAPTDEVPS